MKKLLSVLLAVVSAFTLLAFSGCTEAQDELIVYTEAGFAPFEFKVKGSSEVVGVDMEIAKYIANKYNYKLTVIDGDFNAIVAGINEDNALGIAGISYTAKRAESVLYSDFYYGGAFQTVVYLKSSAPVFDGDDAFAVSNFRGKKVVYQNGTTGNLLVNEKKDAWGVETAGGYGEYAVALEEVKQGAGNTYLIVDSYVAAQFCANDSTLAYANIEGVDSESYGIVAKKGNTALIEKVNVCIQELLTKDGNGKTQIDKWYEQYDALTPEDGE